MASASFTINSVSSPVEVAAGTPTTCTLSSVNGVRPGVAWSFIGKSDSDVAYPAITLSGTPYGSTASFTMPTPADLNAGFSLVLQCVINGGKDDNRQTVAGYTATGLCGVINARALLPWAFGETTERGSIGIADDYNAQMATTGGAATTTAQINSQRVPWKATARFAITSNVSNLASFTVAASEGTAVQNDRLLLTGQTTASQNGLYVVGTVGGGTAPLTRASDMAASADCIPGSRIHVSEGAVHQNSDWYLGTSGSITLGSTSLRFVEVGEVISVRRFGARGDVVFLTGKTITGGASSFTSSDFTSADIGKAIVFNGCGANDANGHAVPMAGTITNVSGTTVSVSFTASQTGTSQKVYYGTDDTAAFQAAYDALSNGQHLFIPAPPGSAYGITSEWGGTKACRIRGDARGSTVLCWLGGPATTGTLVTFTADSSTEFLTANGHGLKNGFVLMFKNTGGALPAPLAAGTRYYVVGATTNTFQLAATYGGAAINLTTNGTGTNQFYEIPRNLHLYGGGIYDSSIEDVQFTAPVYTTIDQVLVEDCSYFLARQLIFGTQTTNPAGDVASNQTNAIHFRNRRTGGVPPRGNIRIADCLVTHEVDTTNADGSHGIWVEGNPDEGFQQVTVEGECNIEQSEFGIRFDYVTGGVIKCAGLIQGNRMNVGVFHCNHTTLRDEVECANAKRTVSSVSLRDIYVDGTDIDGAGTDASEYIAGSPSCTNTHLYDPLASPARTEIGDASHMWIGTETRLCNLPSATLRGTTTTTGKNAVRYGAGGYTSVAVLENTVDDGYCSIRVSMKHGGVQSDVYEEYWDYVGNRQHHIAAGRQERWYDGLSNDNIPCGNVSKYGFQSSLKTSLAGVDARARFDARADTDEICFIAQAGSAQTVNLQEWQLNGGGAAASVTKDGYIGVSDGTTAKPGFFFQGDVNNGLMREGTDNPALVGGGTIMIRWSGSGLGFYGHALQAQQTRAGQLTDSTTGTPSNTIADVGGAFSQAGLNNIHASLLGKINALETIIHNLGLST